MISDRAYCLAAVPVMFGELLAGLRILSVHPIAAVLVLLSAMGLSLRVSAGICGFSGFAATTSGTQLQGKRTP